MSPITAHKRRPASPVGRPEAKRSRSHDDSFLALLMPQYEERVTLPPIAEDRRTFAFTNTFDSQRRPVHTRTYSHDVAFQPPVDWLPRRDDAIDFDSLLESGTSSPAFAFGPGPFSYSPQFHPRSQAPLNMQALSSAAQSPMSSPAVDPSLAPRDMESELSSVRAKIRELEFMNDLLQLRVVELESEKSKDDPAEKASPAFQQSWDARTEARVKRFCSLNRAGNALCAWHDSRRERRSFPPRMAPPGHLNCGCTYEEALFEESLARHGVGSYHPGESVRMDPALRNPLLKLLQWRYGYKDGDFERDPGTGVWVEGEGEHAWESRPHPSSGSSGRRNRERNSAVAE